MTVDSQEGSSVRIATWNINGLRACLRRPGCHHMRSMRQLLDFLDAGQCSPVAALTQTSCCERQPATDLFLICTDIVCFQETKMVRQELSPDLGQVEGW